MTTPEQLPEPGSRASARPRSRRLAHEAPRQLIAGLVPLVLFTWLLFESNPPLSDSPGPFIAFTPTLVWLYGLFMLGLASLYVGLTWFAFRGLDGEELRRLAVSSAPGTQTQRWMRWLGIGEVSLALWSAAVTALATALLLLLPDGLRADGPAVPGALLAAAAGWVLIVVGFATRYLRVWALRDAIAFAADDEPPRFSDFVHLAVHQSTGYGAAVGRLRSAGVRRTATVHSVLAWAFNSVIVALLVSLSLATVL